MSNHLPGMMKIRVLIVDDEPLARERIRALLADASDIEIVDEAATGLAAISSIEKTRPHLLFLDVQMPELDGFAILEAIDASIMPVVIFVTAYDQHALRAFEVHALDYLLKPFDRERFEKALQRAREQIQLERNGNLSQRLQALLADVRSEKKYLERLVIKSRGRVFFLKTNEVDWIEAAGNYARLHVDRESHLLRETIKSLEEKLNPQKFLRINRSTIVNIERVKEKQPWFHGEYILILLDGSKLTLSRGYREKLPGILRNTL